MKNATIRFKGAVLTMSHRYGKATLEWLGVAAFTACMVLFMALCLSDWGTP